MHLVAISIDFWDTATSTTKTLRICSQGPVTDRNIPSGEHYQWIPALYIPFSLGSSIEVDGYGSDIVVQSKRGSIQFAVTDEILVYLMNYVVSGRTFRIFESEQDFDQGSTDDLGNYGDIFAEFELAFTGRVDEISYDAVQRLATIITTDARVDLDRPIIWDLYNDQPTAPATNPPTLPIRGRPKPEAFGEVYCVEPTFEDEADYIYRISRNAISSCSWLRVGGVAWSEDPYPPGSGQWSLVGNAVQLGSSPLAGEIRVAAKAVDWGTCTTGVLVKLFTEVYGGTFEANSFTYLQTNAPYLIGYYLKEPINRQEVISDIMNGVVGWWGTTSANTFSAGLITAPIGPGVRILTEKDIASLELLRILPAAVRIRVEYRRNWQPATQFYTSVPEHEKVNLQVEGLVAPEWILGDEMVVQEQQPRAVDVPLIRSLVLTSADAMSIRDRAAAAFGVQRRVFRVEIAGPHPLDLELMDTVELDFEGISGYFRVTSISRAFGEGLHEVVLWG